MTAPLPAAPVGRHSAREGQTTTGTERNGIIQ
jgi:hypothetical protein